MSNPHHTRSHAVWSASATSRNVHCAGAIAMSSLCEDVEREAAAWGTCAHQIADRCLRSVAELGPSGKHSDASDWLGKTEKSGRFEFVVDEDMANCSKTYVDYCKQRLYEYWKETGEQATFWIEHRLSLAPLNPPLEAGGTGDFVIWFPKWKLLEIVDLKGGKGVTVDVVGNPQGRSYGIGAILSLPDIKPERIKVTIVQPRVGDGLPKSEEFHVADLYDWTHDLLNHMERAAQALADFEKIDGNTVKFDEWAARWLTPGQCTFCTAKPICPALRKQALAAMPELARKWHEDTTLTTPPTLSNLARLGSPEELAHDLDGFDELEGWIKSCRAFAKLQAELGTEVPNYILVDSIGHRKFVEKDETKLLALLTEKFKLKKEQVLEPPAVKSVAQIEKTLGTSRKAEFAKLEKTLWIKPIVGKNLVRADRTTRPAAKNTAERFNETVE